MRIVIIDKLIIPNMHYLLMHLRVEVPDSLWLRFREEVRRRYGTIRGNVGRAVIEALDMWINQTYPSHVSKGETGKFDLSNDEKLAFEVFCVKKLSRKQIEARGLDYEALRRAFISLKEKLLG